MWIWQDEGYGEEGIFVVFNHMVGKVTEYAAKASFRTAEALIVIEEYDLDEDIMNMKEIRQNEGLDHQPVQL